MSFWKSNSFSGRVITTIDTLHEIKNAFWICPWRIGSSASKSSAHVRMLCHLCWERMILILRDRKDFTNDNGVWVASPLEHHPSLKKEFPCMRSVRCLANWNRLAKHPAAETDFEELVLRVCSLIQKGDPRIGKIPKQKRKGRRIDSARCDFYILFEFKSKTPMKTSFRPAAEISASSMADIAFCYSPSFWLPPSFQRQRHCPSFTWVCWAKSYPFINEIF